jgi:hypothetical protein
MRESAGLLRWLSDGPSELLLFIGTTGTAGCSEESRKKGRSGREELNAVAGVISVKLDSGKRLKGDPYLAFKAAR